MDHSEAVNGRFGLREPDTRELAIQLDRLDLVSLPDRLGDPRIVERAVAVASEANVNPDASWALSSRFGVG